MWDSFKKAVAGLADDLLTDEQKAKALELARQAQEAARAAAEQAGAAAKVAGDAASEEYRKWQEAQAAAEEARRVAEAAEAERERGVAAEHGYRAALTYELKKMLGLPITAKEERQKKTAAEDQPPGAFFAPFGRDLPVPGWLNADDPFFTRSVPCLIFETGTMNNGGRSSVTWELRPRFTLNAVTWYFESLIVRALFERWKRGLPVVGDDNQLYQPPLSDDGYPIIDTTEAEDGSVRALVALPDSVLADAADLEAFEKVLGRYRVTPWKGDYRRRVVTPIGAGFVKQYPLSGYSIGRPRVEARTLVRADPNRNPYAPRSTVHGSAQWAWRDRLAIAGMIDPANPEAMTGHTFLGRSHYIDGRGASPLNHMTCFGGDGHRLIVGPPGSGKFTSAIAPLLLWSADKGSAFVFDVKNGEAAKITGEHRATLGPVTVLDPFGISGMPSGGLNPLDLLRADNPQLVATADRLADAIFVPSNAQDQHWDNAAKKTLSALLMHIGTAEIIGADRFDNAPRNLRTLRDIVREQIPDEIIVAMQNNPAGDGEVRAEALALLAAEESDAERYRFSVVQSLNVNIGFLKVPEILTISESTSFDPRQLRERVSTLYVVTPDYQLPVISRWVRVVYAFVMEQLREAKGDTHVHVVMDEFPALGKFERVAQDMAQTRSLGVHMHVVVQTFQQLLDTYGQGWERFQGTSAVTHVLGVRDNFTAEQVSKMLGTTTVRTSGQSQTRGNSGGSQSESSNYAGRALMTPDELLAMPAEECVAVVGGMNPLKLEKVAYFSFK